ncbi:hypothetical protein [Methanobacterium paludis]|nr:hypothetical protein [Methanobacterium paludis]
MESNEMSSVNTGNITQTQIMQCLNDLNLIMDVIIPKIFKGGIL